MMVYGLSWMERGHFPLIIHEERKNKNKKPVAAGRRDEEEEID
jgi:hypothetical protein